MIERGLIKLDPYYDQEQEVVDKSEHARAYHAQRISTQFVKRVISHPSFHNVTHKDAEKMLENMGLGDAIIRPSSLGVNHLVVTWKGWCYHLFRGYIRGLMTTYIHILVAEGVYHHIPVKEGGKKHYFNLGSVLYINEEVPNIHFITVF